MIPFSCEFCGEKRERKQKYIKRDLDKSQNRKFYCSGECSAKGRISQIEFNCAQCDQKGYRIKAQFDRSLNHFCSRSCSAIYSNTHKVKGTRRSKLEAFLDSSLVKLYPDLQFDFNKKNTIGSELDIYIPSLKLAFELNGIFHFKPIFGAEKLNQIKLNDRRKFETCIENGIEYYTINVSSVMHFKDIIGTKYLNLIKTIIDRRLNHKL